MLSLAELPEPFPAAWASAWGQDPYGFWQVVELAGIEQIMRWIAPGEFMMGSPGSEVDRRNDEDLHQVTISNGFWLADTACTQALWQAVVQTNPSDFNDDLQNPVDSVSWLDCQRFFESANQLMTQGLTLRFPTEAEWEYACRAGTDTAFSWGDHLTTELANYNGNYPYADGPKGEDRHQTVSVSTFAPNSWGLYQMHGNVWEWCADRYSEHLTGPAVNPAGPEQGHGRVLRGGGWINRGRNLRSANRYANAPGNRYHYYGLRLAGG